MTAKVTVCWTETATYRTTVTLSDHHRDAMRGQGHNPTCPSDIRDYLNDDETWLADVDIDRDFDRGFVAVTRREVDAVIVTFELGEGELGWPPDERVSDRYGTVFLATGSDAEDFVSFGSAPVGERGRLVAVVLATRRSAHIGDLFRGIFPTTPDVGEQITLGAGALFTDTRGGTPVVGLSPDDDRDSDWLDLRALYRCHSQTVRLELRRD